MLKSWNFSSFCAPQKFQPLSPFQACSQSLLAYLISPEYALLTALTHDSLKTLSFLLNWSLNHVLIKVNGHKTNIGIKMGLIAIQDSLVVVFPAILAAPQTARVSGPSHSCQKKFWQKESLIHVYQCSNTQPCKCQVNPQPFNQFMFHDNSYKSRIILSLITIKHFMIKTNKQ